MIDSSRLAPLRPLPPSRKMALAHWYHPARHVPSMWSFTTSTACSAATLQMYCNLLPVMGFDTFHGSCDVQANLSVITPAPRIAVSDPSKNTTRRQPHRVTAAVASMMFMLVCTTPRMHAPGKPAAHRGSCPRSEDQDVALATRLGLPHTPADVLTIPRETPTRVGSEVSQPRAREARDLLPTTRASRRLSEPPKRPLITSLRRASRTSPRGCISAGNANLTSPRRHRPRLQPPRGATAPNLPASRLACWCEHRESRSSRTSEEAPLYARSRWP
jgi:hypothetical protein